MSDLDFSGLQPWHDPQNRECLYNTAGKYWACTCTEPRPSGNPQYERWLKKLSNNALIMEGLATLLARTKSHENAPANSLTEELLKRAGK